MSQGNRLRRARPAPSSSAQQRAPRSPALRSGEAPRVVQASLRDLPGPSKPASTREEPVRRPRRPEPQALPSPAERSLVPAGEVRMEAKPAAARAEPASTREVAATRAARSRGHRQAVAAPKIDGLGAYAELAFRHMRSGDHDQAMKIFEALTTIDPRESYYWLGLGITAERQGLWELADRAHRRAAKLDPQHPVPLVGLSEVALAVGRAADAQTYLGYALERARNPQHTGLLEQIEARLRLLAKGRQNKRNGLQRTDMRRVVR